MASNRIPIGTAVERMAQLPDRLPIVISVTGDRPGLTKLNVETTPLGARNFLRHYGEDEPIEFLWGRRAVRA